MTDRFAQASALSRVGRYEEARELYEGVVADYPSNIYARFHAGWCSKILGERERAISAWREALFIRPDFGTAWWALSDLKDYYFVPREVAVMRGALHDKETPTQWKTEIGFALGLHYEHLGEVDKAAVCYVEANARRWQMQPFDAAGHAAWLERNKRFWTVPPSSDHILGGPTPIFIVGLPRSGSTLLEQMLGCHPLIEATTELTELYMLGSRELGAAYPEVCSSLTPDDCAALGDRYIERTAWARKTGKPYFIDKLGSNYLFVPLIRLILPHAKIIDMRRDPRANGFSCWKQYFPGNGYSWMYEQKTLARYMCAYRDWMDFCAPDGLLIGSYEDLVDNPRAELSAILEGSGLPFHEAMLEHTKLKRPQRTASGEQVLKPIYTSALTDWERFKPYLQPLLEDLKWDY